MNINNLIKHLEREVARPTNICMVCLNKDEMEYILELIKESLDERSQTS